MGSKIVYVDMDDVLCDFKGAHAAAVQREPRIAFPQSQMGFFTGLDPLPLAISSVRRLSSLYEVYILTRPSVMNPMCYTEKRVWVEKHLGLAWCDRLIINPHKGLMIGDYLIDDQPWPEFKGEQIHFGQGEFRGWAEVMKYLCPDEGQNGWDRSDIYEDIIGL